MMTPVPQGRAQVFVHFIMALIPAVCALISGGLVLWQWLASIRFPLHRRRSAGHVSSWPSITLFKPLKGADSRTEECLRSWFCQHYPGSIQFLFGVASMEDPACDVVRRLQKEFHQADVELVHCPLSLGANAKVSSLAQMQVKALGEWVLVSDSDVWAPPDLLEQLMIQAGGRGNLLLCTFYRLTGRDTAAMRWEALVVNSDFWSQVLQSKDLKPVDFALGAVMALPRQTLISIGGFEPIAQFLADDYQLGNRVVKGGGKVELGSVVVECRGGPLTWAAAWSHQLRWARTIRVCQPAPFFFSLLSNGSLWPLLWLASSPSAISLRVGGILLLSRVLTALHQEARIRDGAVRWAEAGRVLLKDLLNFAIWIGAFTGSTVSWRGRKFRVASDGRMTPVAE